MVDLGSILSLPVDCFPGGVIPVTSMLTVQWPPCQMSDVMGSAMALSGPVDVGSSVASMGSAWH